MKAGGSSKARKRATSNASGKSEHSNYAISVDSRESGEGSAGSRQLLERRQKKGAARKGGDGDNDIVKGIRDDGSGDKENVHGRRGRRPSFSTEDVEQSVHDKAWTVVLCALVVIFSCAAVYRYSANIRAGHAQSWDLVLVYGLITALSTGLGALPFVFLSTLRSGLVGIANSVAAGMMLAASIVLLAESFTAEEGSKVDTSAMFAGLQHDSVLGLGLGLGAVFVALSERYLENASDDALTGLSEFGSRRAILFVAVMTVHSLAEGIGIGVSFHGSSGLQTGSVISAALAVHNIPEGMAVCLVLVPRGVGVLRAFLWAIVSSIPQPLVAVPTFWFVELFAPLMPLGFGFSAGAMLWLVTFGLVPESVEACGRARTAAGVVVGCLVMAGLQVVISGAFAR